VWLVAGMLLFCFVAVGSTMREGLSACLFSLDVFFTHATGVCLSLKQ
jgi:hypothetical protein